ncbi:regulator of G-protein signaling 9-like [Nematolebias whitei]|uniref:regulator of G-protein signaling 9-like n=1 Tax=Nematolebias whitei TaxID=451745 RepID=UPI001897796E|nr:regulator of G-protein signaling 9-like [Nematolebias whitei]
MEPFIDLELSVDLEPSVDLELSVGLELSGDLEFSVDLERSGDSADEGSSSDCECVALSDCTHLSSATTAICEIPQSFIFTSFGLHPAADMTIRTARPNRGQHFRSRLHCLRKLEAIVVEMQDPRGGVKGSVQKLNVTTIPHAVVGETNSNSELQQEAQVFSTMLVAFGFIYPLQNHKKLVMCNDSSLYRFQTPYFWPTQKWVPEDSDYAIYLAKRNIRKKGMLEPYEQAHYSHLHDWLNHKWDFIVMQATEQYKAGRDRNKPDRVVFDCQERAYWIVNRPPF